MDIYVVKEGDTVDSIAFYFGISINSLIYANQLEYPYRLAIGQSMLIVDDLELSGLLYRENILRANGFAYPFISPWVLNETLPYLEEMSVFSYGFSEDGELIPPALSVEWMINDALYKGVRPVLTLTPFGKDGQFNNYLIHRMLINERARGNLIANIVDTIIEMGFEGVNIDFEFILSEDRDNFTQFVGDVTNAVNELGYEVTVDLAPKTSSTQSGLLYEGKDYMGLGNASNRAFVMTYEWGYTYGPAMAVAPINKVRQVLEYATTQIPSEKISMGIPNYGYDFTQPYVRGESKAKTIGNIEAVNIAINNNSIIMFDEISKTPFFSYVEDNVTHEVWFEDARSIFEKYKLIKEYNLYGFGCWQIMQLFRPMWILSRANLGDISVL
jgi:spore germination protein